MKRLYLTVEGQTEAAFAVTVLAPHLSNFNVFLFRPRFTGLHRRRRGRIPHGGLLHTFGHALADVRTWLKEDPSPGARYSINHGQHSHPKYRIQHRFPDYDENVAGPLLAEQIGLPTLRERYEHFGEWLTKLEQMDTAGS